MTIPDEQQLHGASIIAAIKASGIEFVVSVPDITTSEGLLRQLAQMKAPRLIRISGRTAGWSTSSSSATERRSPARRA